MKNEIRQDKIRQDNIRVGSGSESGPISLTKYPTPTPDKHVNAGHWILDRVSVSVPMISHITQRKHIE